jgi:hypothetical protein
VKAAVASNLEPFLAHGGIVAEIDRRLSTRDYLLGSYSVADVGLLFEH